MGLREKWVDKQNSTNGIDGNNIDANDINVIAHAVIDLEENGTGGSGSASGVIEFSNGIQLKAVGDEIFVYKDGEFQDTFVTTSDGKHIVSASLAGKAEADVNGNFIDEHYATKEEVGNIETALDNIIAEQEAIIAIQNSLIGGDNS